mmetsp:Transcript_138126/g.275386  ORF Transcript_138126/g.275386 Transcript_138126/m.275386 type:complete len:145 (+) Transcript_138126:107-541(+)
MLSFGMMAPEGGSRGSVSRCQSPEAFYFDPASPDRSDMLCFEPSSGHLLGPVRCRQLSIDTANLKRLPLQTIPRFPVEPWSDMCLSGEDSDSLAAPSVGDAPDCNPQPELDGHPLGLPPRWKRGRRGGQRARTKREKQAKQLGQ